MDFRDRIEAWQHTCDFLSKDPRAKTFHPPSAKKIRHNEIGDECLRDISRRYSSSGTPTLRVENEDCLVVARILLRRGLRPMVLILADNRFAGGDVRMGSGAQEESLFRRTNLSAALIQHPALYPIAPDEAVVCLNVTVFKGAENEDEYCRMLSSPFRLDFIACPALQRPQLTYEGSLREEDETVLRKKLRLVFQAAYRCRNDSVILGAMGCGAWRNPPEHVARIMREECEMIKHAFREIIVACLDVDPKSYIVLNRDAPSNFATFQEVFARGSLTDT